MTVNFSGEELDEVQCLLDDVLEGYENEEYADPLEQDEDVVNHEGEYEDDKYSDALEQNEEVIDHVEERDTFREHEGAVEQPLTELEQAFMDLPEYEDSRELEIHDNDSGGHLFFEKCGLLKLIFFLYLQK